MMDWACLHAKARGYKYWSAFTTGKSPSLGGIPHDLYGKKDCFFLSLVLIYSNSSFIQFNILSHDIEQKWINVTFCLYVF
jgi:hypothetical protein